MTTPRWFTDTDADHSQSYIERIRALAAEGTDLGGEARLIDAMVPRGSRILDAGCGPGRVGAVLHACGHEVVATVVGVLGGVVLLWMGAGLCICFL